MNTPTKQSGYQSESAGAYVSDGAQQFDFPSLDELDPSLGD